MIGPLSGSKIHSLLLSSFEATRETRKPDKLQESLCPGLDLMIHCEGSQLQRRKRMLLQLKTLYLILEENDGLKLVKTEKILELLQS